MVPIQKASEPPSHPATTSATTPRGMKTRLITLSSNSRVDHHTQSKPLGYTKEDAASKRYRPYTKHEICCEIIGKSEGVGELGPVRGTRAKTEVADEKQAHPNHYHNWVKWSSHLVVYSCGIQDYLHISTMTSYHRYTLPGCPCILLELKDG
jgi:hypothetical protein